MKTVNAYNICQLANENSEAPTISQRYLLNRVISEESSSGTWNFEELPTETKYEILVQ